MNSSNLTAFGGPVMPRFFTGSTVHILVERFDHFGELIKIDDLAALWRLPNGQTHPGKVQKRGTGRRLVSCLCLKPGIWTVVLRYEGPRVSVISRQFEVRGLDQGPIPPDWATTDPSLSFDVPSNSGYIALL